MLKLLRTIDELNNWRESKGITPSKLGFVPTMGALHEGHLSLIKKAKEDNPFVLVSVFVNPTQFAPNEDFEKYPRPLEKDCEKAESAGADAVFAPSVEEMYPPDASTFVDVEHSMKDQLCGASRPTHFKGVTTVVNMLFNIAQAGKAYFGQKDAQQAAIIKRMIRDLHMPVDIVVCPIVREPDGLALSSRNVYLSASERKHAVILNQALVKLKDRFMAGERSVNYLEDFLKNELEKAYLGRIDYARIVAFDDLSELTTIEKPALAAVAVFFGSTRLIDNVVLDPGGN